MPIVTYTNLQRNLYPEELDILRILRNEPGLRARDVAERLRKTKARWNGAPKPTERRLAYLVARGFVTFGRGESYTDTGMGRPPRAYRLTDRGHEVTPL